MRGKRPYLEVSVQREIARLYFDENRTARELALLFRPFSPTGNLSPSAIRAIARKALGRRA